MEATSDIKVGLYDWQVNVTFDITEKQWRFYSYSPKVRDSLCGWTVVCEILELDAVGQCLLSALSLLFLPHPPSSTSSFTSSPLPISLSSVISHPPSHFSLFPLPHSLFPLYFPCLILSFPSLYSPTFLPVSLSPSLLSPLPLPLPSSRHQPAVSDRLSILSYCRPARQGEWRNILAFYKTHQSEAILQFYDKHSLAADEEAADECI